MKYTVRGAGCIDTSFIFCFVTIKPFPFILFCSHTYSTQVWNYGHGERILNTQQRKITSEIKRGGLHSPSLWCGLMPLLLLDKTSVPSPRSSRWCPSFVPAMQSFCLRERQTFSSHPRRLNRVLFFSRTAERWRWKLDMSIFLTEESRSSIIIFLELLPAFYQPVQSQ